MTLNLTKMLRQLVAIPSVNPMGRPAVGPEMLESRLTDHLEAVFDEIGVPHVRQAVHPGRENLIARLDGRIPPERGGRLVLLEAHQDTVPVEGMTIEPFAAEVRDGRLHGRGACDVKGGMVAMLAALARWAAERPAKRPTIAMACTVNEEHGFSGADALTRLWASSGGLIPRQPDLAVVAEPTGLDVVVAHKGVLRWRCHATGRAAHSAQPQRGENAIYRIGHALVGLERYARDVVGELASHALCGRPTLSVGVIRGGLSVNTVPDRATIEIDRRILPGEDVEQARRHVVDWLARQNSTGTSLEHDPPFLQAPALSDEDNGPLAAQLASVARAVVGRCGLIGVPYGTDAAVFAKAGIPSVVFGPGSIEQAHTKDEWISLDQLEQAAEILYRFGREAFGG